MSVDVGVVKLPAARYPRSSPYHPSDEYPEYPFAGHVSEEPNLVYRAVRDLFFQLRYDRENFDSSSWNPLGFLIEPGMTVVLKPNFVRSRHFENKDPFAMITHPSVLRAVADYVWVALGGEGKIIIADAPQYDANWDELLDLTGLDTLREFYNSQRPGIVEVFDLRNYWSRKRHFPSMLLPLPGDPNGIVHVDLGVESAVRGIDNPRQ